MLPELLYKASNRHAGTRKPTPLLATHDFVKSLMKTEQKVTKLVGF